MPFNVGETVGPYRIIEQLGQGGMGVVYEAVDKALGRKVAIKMLLDEYQIDAQAKAHQQVIHAHGAKPHPMKLAFEA